MLADYVLALLRHDGDTETVRALCMAEIPDFLKEDSTVFVQDVFDAIQYKSYLPGAPPAPQRRSSVPGGASSFAPPTGPSMPGLGMLQQGRHGGQNGIDGGRKRRYDGTGDSQMGGMGMGDVNGRTYKQPRRGGMPGRGGYDGFNGRGGGYSGRPTPMGAPGFPPPIDQSMLPPGLPPLDPNDPQSLLNAMQMMQNMQQALGLPPSNSPGLGGPPPVPNHQPRRGRCRDYDQKGFCARGNTCMFEHGENSIWVPPKKPDEYDPATAGLLPNSDRNPNMGGSGGFNNFRGNDRGRGRGAPNRGDRGNQHGNMGRRNGRAEFSSDKPNYDRSKTKIVVENIPEEKFTEDDVREFFSQFGNIVEVSMRPYKRLAIVKFEDYDAAQAAYSSPKVIFDNRFVKVYWYTNLENLPQPPSTVAGANGTPTKRENSSKPSFKAEARDDEPAIDPEEFARKQQEAQKAHEEKAKKKAEMEVARKELEKRSEELKKSQAEEKRKLLEKINAKEGKLGGSMNGVAKSEGDEKPSQTESLKAQLAALQAEADSLGLPGLDQPLTEDISFGYRGRGRGRGGYRGRGTFAPRGFRGGYRGRGGAPFGGGTSVKRLDNRPKTIALTGVDFTESSHEEALRGYLLVSVSPASTHLLTY